MYLLPISRIFSIPQASFRAPSPGYSSSLLLDNGIKSDSSEELLPQEGSIIGFVLIQRTGEGDSLLTIKRAFPRLVDLLVSFFVCHIRSFAKLEKESMLSNGKFCRASPHFILIIMAVMM